MGAKCCGIHYHHPDIDQAKQQLGDLHLHQKQIQILHLIYQDLSERTIQKAITLENFSLFFHKNGFWGERLFKQFGYTQTNVLVQKDFIIGIAKLLKANEQQKIELLFKEFSNNYHKKFNGQINGQLSSQTTEEGITFDDFLVMLYNYPKQDLKNVLNDKYFFQSELRGSLKTIGQNRRLQSVYKMGTYFEKNKPLECRMQEKSESGQGNMGSCRSMNNQIRSSYGSLVGKNILKHLKSRPSQQTTIKIEDGQQVIEIKTNNFHQLVKKFAVRMFKDMNINKKTQKMTKQQFQSWIFKHRKLYETYFSGFHNQIWQIDEKTNQPMYVTCNFEIKSQCKYYHPDFALKENKFIRAQAMLIHSIIIVCHIDMIDEPYETICLEGLTVDTVDDNQIGYGIAISHRDGIYHRRQLFFDNQYLRNEWFQLLKMFKGQNIQTLYTMKKKIGTGKFSVVYKGIEKATGNKCAIKVIQSYKLDPEEKNLIAHQTGIMKMFSHPLLVQYKNDIQTKTHLYIITELCEGKDLFEFVKDFSFFSEYDASIILQQVIVGVLHMHSFGIVHRDLKPENIMVSTSNGHVDKIKIIDFGFANYLETLQELPPEEVLAGTPNYIAPEILRRGEISFKIDVFALGSILYYMLSGLLPFNDYSLLEIFNRTLDGQYQFPEKKFDKVSSQAKNLIQKLLENDPEQRINLEDALKHPWFKVAWQNKSKELIPKKVGKITIF